MLNKPIKQKIIKAKRMIVFATIKEPIDNLYLILNLFFNKKAFIGSPPTWKKM